MRIREKQVFVQSELERTREQQLQLRYEVGYEAAEGFSKDEIHEKSLRPSSSSSDSGSEEWSDDEGGRGAEAGEESPVSGWSAAGEEREEARRHTVTVTVRPSDCDAFSDLQAGACVAFCDDAMARWVRSSVPEGNWRAAISSVSMTRTARVRVDAELSLSCQVTEWSATGFAAVVVARLPGTGETAFSCECGFDGLAASGAGWAAAAPPSAFRQEWAE